MGGAAAVIERARADVGRGEYRFVAEAMSHVVFADPANTEARRLGADALEQLGYAAESVLWRNVYLVGAHELRQGLPPAGGRALPNPYTVGAMRLDFVFDYLGVRLNAEQAEGKAMVVNWVCSDLGRQYVTTLSNAAVTALADRTSDRADATVTLERDVLNRLITGELPFADALQQGLISIAGDGARVAELFGLLDDFSPTFPIVEPRPEP
jgi:alkyl sulfatase BDS1-like metallo-beta-lactamase superfamily hydrolase